MSLNNAAILIVCDDAQLADTLVSHIHRASGDVVCAANKVEAFRYLEQFTFSAAVLAQQAEADAVAAKLRDKHVPCCVLVDKVASKPINVTVQGAVAVNDVALVVPTLGALVAQRRK